MTLETQPFPASPEASNEDLLSTLPPALRDFYEQNPDLLEGRQAAEAALKAALYQDRLELEEINFQRALNQIAAIKSSPEVQANPLALAEVLNFEARTLTKRGQDGDYAQALERLAKAQTVIAQSPEPDSFSLKLKFTQAKVLLRAERPVEAADLLADLLKEAQERKTPVLMIELEAIEASLAAVKASLAAAQYEEGQKFYTRALEQYAAFKTQDPGLNKSEIFRETLAGLEEEFATIFPDNLRSSFPQELAAHHPNNLAQLAANQPHLNEDQPVAPLADIKREETPPSNKTEVALDPQKPADSSESAATRPKESEPSRRELLKASLRKKLESVLGKIPRPNHPKSTAIDARA